MFYLLAGGVVTEPCEDKIVQLLSSPVHSITTFIPSTCSTLTGVTTHTPPHLPYGETEDGGRKGRHGKMALLAGHEQTYKPLIKALKGLSKF